MLRDRDGNRLFKRVEVTIHLNKDVFPKPQRRVFSPKEPRQAYSEEGIYQILNEITDWLDVTYPFWNFELVPLRPEGRTARYVVNYAGIRPMPEPPQESFSHPVGNDASEEQKQS